MNTVALELVPPGLDGGEQQAVEEGKKVAEHARASGVGDHLRHIMIPGMIAEDPDRPVEMAPKMDVLDFWTAVRPELGAVSGLCTQVTAFSDEEQLTARLRRLREAGMDGVTFVGVPRTMVDGEGPGMAPTDALDRFRDVMPNRGAILIPTRDGEDGRFTFKCERGATFAMTQLLYSENVVGFLRAFAAQRPHRPEILLSFGFVPSVERSGKLIDWLIQDPGNDRVAAEQKFVARVAEGTLAERRGALVELYKRVVDGVRELGFPLSIHLEAPYGNSRPALDTFAEMLEHFSPASLVG
jgi:hypothetical protein